MWRDGTTSGRASVLGGGVCQTDGVAPNAEASCLRAAGGLPPGRMEINGVAHLFLTVSNMAVSQPFYEKLRKNDIMVVQGNQQVSDNIKRGERLIAVGALDSYAADDRRAGHPIVTILPADGTFVIPAPTALVKGSPNPNAGKLLAEFMIGDAVQSLFPADGGYAARKDFPPPADGVALDKISILAVDYDYIEKEAARIKRKFSEVFQ